MAMLLVSLTSCALAIVYPPPDDINRPWLTHPDTQVERDAYAMGYSAGPLCFVIPVIAIVVNLVSKGWLKAISGLIGIAGIMFIVLA